MARPKKQLHRREDILKIAQQLFKKNSYEKTTVDDIAAHAGISKGSVYLEFKTKEDIFYSIIESYIKIQLGNFSKIINTATPPYLPHLKTFLVEDVLTVYDMFAEGYQNCEIMMYTDKDVKSRFEPLFRDWADLLYKLIEKAKNNNEIGCNHENKLISKLIDIGMVGFYPPYNCNPYYSKDFNSQLSTKEVRNSLKKDLSSYLDILFVGLKNGRIANEE